MPFVRGLSASWAMLIFHHLLSPCHTAWKRMLPGRREITVMFTGLRTVLAFIKNASRLWECSEVFQYT